MYVHSRRCSAHFSMHDDGEVGRSGMVGGKSEADSKDILGFRLAVTRFLGKLKNELGAT